MQIKLQKRVDFHENILRFHGITKMRENSMFLYVLYILLIKIFFNELNFNAYLDINQEYALVLEYADSDTLNTYLRRNSDKLEWDDKYRFALQLASAVACIHECDIIHRDLVISQIL